MNSLIGHLHFAKSNFLYMSKYLHADLIENPHIQGGFGGEGGESECLSGEKAGAVGPKAALSWASPAAGSFYGALPSMRREFHGLPMWQECRGNNQTSNRDKRPRATSTFPSIFLPPPPHSPPRAALLARALPQPPHGAGIRESGNQICCWRERRGGAA